MTSALGMDRRRTYYLRGEGTEIGWAFALVAPPDCPLVERRTVWEGTWSTLQGRTAGRDDEAVWAELNAELRPGWTLSRLPDDWRETHPCGASRGFGSVPCDLPDEHDGEHWSGNWTWRRREEPEDLNLRLADGRHRFQAWREDEGWEPLPPVRA